MSDIEAQIQLGYQHHSRLSEFDRLVYPVVSRRAHGLSLGINLNPDKRCNFDCVYCQVQRSERIPPRTPDLVQLEDELRFWLGRTAEEGFRGYPLQDIAMAGDGEPSVVRDLPKVLALLQRLKTEYRLDGVKQVLFTNGSGLERADLAPQWPGFFAADGEVWLKLDAWDAESLGRINRTRLSFDRLRQHSMAFAKQYPVTLQSCLFCWQNERFSVGHYQGYIDYVKALLEEGARINRIQAYTLARVPAESAAQPWSDAQMSVLGQAIRTQIEVPVEVYFEHGDEG